MKNLDKRTLFLYQFYYVAVENFSRIKSWARISSVKDLVLLCEISADISRYFWHIDYKNLFVPEKFSEISMNNLIGSFRIYKKNSSMHFLESLSASELGFRVLENLESFHWIELLNHLNSSLDGFNSDFEWEYSRDYLKLKIHIRDSLTMVEHKFRHWRWWLPEITELKKRLLFSAFLDAQLQTCLMGGKFICHSLEDGEIGLEIWIPKADFNAVILSNEGREQILSSFLRMLLDLFSQVVIEIRLKLPESIAKLNLPEGNPSSSKEGFNEIRSHAEDRFFSAINSIALLSKMFQDWFAYCWTEYPFIKFDLVEILTHSKQAKVELSSLSPCYIQGPKPPIWLVLEGFVEGARKLLNSQSLLLEITDMESEIWIKATGTCGTMEPHYLLELYYDEKKRTHYSVHLGNKEDRLSNDWLDAAAIPRVPEYLIFTMGGYFEIVNNPEVVPCVKLSLPKIIEKDLKAYDFELTS